MATKFEKLKPNSTLRATILQKIRDAIVKGELPLGSQINQSELAEYFGTSRAPIREALSLLEQEGLVENIPYRGTFVTDFAKQPVEDIYEIRLLLEVYAVEQAIQRGTPEQFKELRDCFEAMGQKAVQGDIEAFYELDVQFHERIHLMTHNPLLFSLWQVMSSSIRRGIYLTNPIHRGMFTFNDLLEQHRPILDAIELKDIEQAKLRMRDHIALSRDNQTRSMRMLS